MTCIGNSGPLPEPVSQAIEKVSVVFCTYMYCWRKLQTIQSYIGKKNRQFSPLTVTI